MWAGLYSSRTVHTDDNSHRLYEWRSVSSTEKMTCQHFWSTCIWYEPLAFPMKCFLQAMTVSLMCFSISHIHTHAHKERGEKKRETSKQIPNGHTLHIFLMQMSSVNFHCLELDDLGEHKSSCNLHKQTVSLWSPVGNLALELMEWDVHEFLVLI